MWHRPCAIAPTDWPTPLHILESEADKFAAFDAADAALAASGTVTTELALAGTPMVVGYKLGWLTYALARPFVTVRFATLGNIILDRAAIPEFIQNDCTAENLARRTRCRCSATRPNGASRSRI